MNDEEWDETDVMRVGRKLGRTLYLSKAGEPEYPGKVIGIVDTRGLAEEIVYRWNLQVPSVGRITPDSEELYYDTPRGAPKKIQSGQRWTPDNPCRICGATSNISHHHSCANYGLYDDNGFSLRAFPKIKADIKVTREDLGMTNPEASPILRYFAYLHLPEHLQDISKLFCDLAEELEDILPARPEKTVALRKLLEAKDAAVRSRL